MNSETKVAVGLATYKRPKMVAQALASLANMKFLGDLSVELIIVSNEIGGVQSLKQLLKDFPLPFTLEVELKRGIVYTRNRILSIAGKIGADYIAFFDDDEKVDSGWLMHLLLTIEKYQADAVEGFVKYNLPSDTPKWLLEKGFYGKDQRKTGVRLGSASTNNVIIAMDFIIKYRLSFDERLNESGSSDTLFFRQLVSKGGKLVWCNEAVSYEEVSHERANSEWILKRSYKSGFNTVLINEIRFGKLISILLVPFYVIQLLATFSYSQLINPPFRKSNVIYNRRYLSEMMGAIAFVIGKKMHYYKTVIGH
ncbi:MAG: glycosyltransferase [Ekhidna sp.]|nr:glycosyltransferase [Ekhidna sp.]